MVQLASEITLSELDVECAVLGSFFASPQQFAEAGMDIDPAWFNEPFVRYVFEECRELAKAGNTLTASVIISMLPEKVINLPREQFYANVRMEAVHVSQLGALLGVLKNRWARRTLNSTADAIRAETKLFENDPFEIAADTVRALDNLNAARREKMVGTLSSAAKSLIASIGRPEALRGATTGLLAVDKKLNGYKAGQLYVIAGRPGMGKSAFMVSSLRRTAAAGYGVGIFSLEMTQEEIAARAISDSLDSINAPGFGSILKGLLSEADERDIVDAAARLADLPLHIDASPRLTFSEIAARARRLKTTLEAEGRFLAVLCIDHMGLVTPSDRYAGNKVAETGEISALARALAKELDCCVLLLCQLSREVEKRDDKRPVMSDLRWSGEIEQDAHVIAFLFREHYYLNQDPSADPGRLSAARFRLDFLIRKNRNGETGDVPLWCSIAHSSIQDLD